MGILRTFVIPGHPDDDLFCCRPIGDRLSYRIEIRLRAPQSAANLHGAGQYLTEWPHFLKGHRLLSHQDCFVPELVPEVVRHGHFDGLQQPHDTDHGYHYGNHDLDQGETPVILP